MTDVFNWRKTPSAIAQKLQRDRNAGHTQNKPLTVMAKFIGSSIASPQAAKQQPGMGRSRTA